MDVFLWFIAGAFFLVLFMALGIWQRSILGSQRQKVIHDIHEAKSRKTDRALAQHPQIQPNLCIGCASCVSVCPENEVLGVVDGIAHVIHGARCIGHGICEEACPVGAIKVGLGDLANRSDIPKLSNSLESTVPGIYVVGELGGLALIRNAIDQGAKAMTDIAIKSHACKRRLPDGIFDALIVGAGPAGLAASLKAVEQELRYVAITQEDLGGTVRQYPRRKLTLTQPVTLPLHGRMKQYEYEKEKLIDLWEEIREQYKLNLRSGIKFLSVQKNGEIFESETSEGPVRSRFVVLALGRRGTPRKLGVPGEDSSKVFYRLIDAATYRNEDLLVVGGGDSAIEAATGLANQPGNVVTLSYRKSSFFRLKVRNEERIQRYIANGRVRVLFSSDVKSIGPHSVTLVLRGDEIIDGEVHGGNQRCLKIPNDQVFVFAGGEPPFPLLEKIGMEFGDGHDEAEMKEKPITRQVSH